jgi:hypothetical protein
MSSRLSAAAVTGRGLLAVATAVGVALTPTLVAGDGRASEAAALPVTLPGLQTTPSVGQEEPGYPRQARLTEPPVDEGDAALRPGLTAYHDISRRLNAVMRRSDRVSAEVLGTSAGGREIILVTLTAPETAAEARLQVAMRERITADPAGAARDRALGQRYKLPVMVNANIHGDEYEGTDAVLRLVEDWAVSDDPAVERTLQTTRVHLVVSMNPDGRVTNTRANGAGFDLNRDLITATQPETVAVRDAIVRLQPVMLLDLHGYVNGTLVEPTTAPHGDNAEHDLLVRHAYPNALGIEQAILALGLDETDGVRPPQVPLRDFEEGWDGWPPIFTPQYASLHGVVAHTVELPLRINNAAYGEPESELRRRSAINTDIAQAAVTSTLAYVVEHRADLLADHVEVFRRGVAGEAQHPVEPGLLGVIGPEDVWTTDFPRAYVIPAGAGQRSAPAATRLVQHLLDNGVEVTRLTRPAAVDGTVYPAGSHVVDLHQARRGVANAILGPGTDLSARVDAMYDISSWSHGLLWGADVVTVPDGVPLTVAGEEVSAAEPAGSLAPSARGWLLRLDDPADLAALSALQDDGVAVEWLDDGSVLVPATAARSARSVVEQLGVRLTAAPAGAAGERLQPLRVGVAGTPQELWALAEMDVVTRPVSTAALNDGLDLSALDALYVSDGLTWRELDAAARAELRAFVADGGGLVGRGPAGAELNDALDLLDVTAVEGRADANGVVAVDNAGGPVTGGAPEHTFVYSPLWFTDLGDDVVADQRLADDPLVSGHWRAAGDGSGGPDEAAGRALLVRGEDADTGARTVLLGSEPLFRAHPKGQYALVARALLWSSLAD